MTRPRATAVLVLAALALAGCGNLIEEPDHVGWVGVRADDRGRPVVVIVPCRAGTPFVSISGMRTPGMPADEENEEYGEWSATEPTSRVTTFSPADPGPGWSPADGVELDPGLGYIVHGSFVGEDRTVLVGPSFTLDDLAGLGPDEVLAEEGPEGSEPVTQSELEARCGG